MKYPVLAVGFLLAFVAVISFVSCGGSDDDDPTGPGQAEALTTAKAKVAADAVMTLTDRDEVVTDEGANWHVSFPFKASLDRIGGEPHVKISKADGSIVRTYYTQ